MDMLKVASFYLFFVVGNDVDGDNDLTWHGPFNGIEHLSIIICRITARPDGICSALCTTISGPLRTLESLRESVFLSILPSTLGLFVFAQYIVRIFIRTLNNVACLLLAIYTDVHCENVPPCQGAGRFVSQKYKKNDHRRTTGSF